MLREVAMFSNLVNIIGHNPTITGQDCKALT